MASEPPPRPADKPEILVVARLWPPMMESLRAAFVVHDRVHEGAAAFAAAAAKIRAISASGESRVSRELMARLAALEIISVVGSATWQTCRAMAELAAGNLQAHFAGRTLLSPVS